MSLDNPKFRELVITAVNDAAKRSPNLEADAAWLVSYFHVVWCSERQDILITFDLYKPVLKELMHFDVNAGKHAKIKYRIESNVDAINGISLTTLMQTHRHD